MKIIIQNHTDQFALSRSQIECIKNILPKEYFQPVKSFHLLDDHRNIEVFEYFKDDRIVWYSFLVKEKTSEIITKAIEELLIGLARIKANSRFYHPLKDNERLEYQPFVDKWLPKCLEAIENMKD